MELRAENISRSFGKHRAVDGISFSVTPGKITALVGPNGCGKTTTMLMLAGLLNPDTGWVRVDEDVVASADTKHPLRVGQAARARGKIGWMPDEFGSWPSLRCEDVLAAFAGFYDVPKPRERARELMKQFGMESFAKEKLITLSRGQKQRLGLARALVNRPKYLILDEPSNGMDPQSRRDLRFLLRDLASDGCGILISSHVLVELNDVADDAIFMKSGQIVPSDMTAQLHWQLEVLNPQAWTQFAESTPQLQWRWEARSGNSFQVGVDSEAVGEGESHGVGRPLRLVAADATQAAEYLAAACARGVRVCAMHPLKQDLESRYLDATDTDASLEVKP
ncbi:MAG: ABC transporter ATP-binding protein [Actinomycetaceae bacterium]|nr:ABC transporter ATP-binding protein [Actinomycetaceae bacterium]